jgi:hypothetical protein
MTATVSILKSYRRAGVGNYIEDATAKSLSGLKSIRYSLIQKVKSFISCIGFLLFVFHARWYIVTPNQSPVTSPQSPDGTMFSALGLRASAVRQMQVAMIVTFYRPPDGMCWGVFIPE